MLTNVDKHSAMVGVLSFSALILAAVASAAMLLSQLSAPGEASPPQEQTYDRSLRLKVAEASPELRTYCTNVAGTGAYILGHRLEGRPIDEERYYISESLVQTNSGQANVVLMGTLLNWAYATSDRTTAAFHARVYQECMVGWGVLPEHRDGSTPNAKF